MPYAKKHSQFARDVLHKKLSEMPNDWTKIISILGNSWCIYQVCKAQLLSHRGQNSKQINIPKCVSKFLIHGVKMLDKCAASKKRIFVHCPFFAKSS